MLQRKVTFRMYANAAETAALLNTHALHCRVQNALLEEHKRRYEAKEPGFNFTAMCKALTEWRTRSPALSGLNAQSLQVTAKRAALAFESFFRRAKAGEVAGYPRFKSSDRFSGWGYKTYGDGWKLLGHSVKVKNGNPSAFGYCAVRLSGIGTISLRGKARFEGTPKTAEVLKKGDKWYLSVTFDVQEQSVQRASGAESIAFDWGLTTLLTQVVGDPMTGTIKTVDNPRWLRQQLERLVRIQKTISALENQSKAKSGKAVAFPVGVQLRAAYARLRALHSKVARQRQDFYHQLTAALVARYGLIVTEELAVKNMSRATKAKPDPDKPGEFLRNGAAAKAGLNRSILDAAPAGLLSKLRYKAEEAGSKFMLVPTRTVKPTQRCHLCGKTTRLELKDRQWTCACGAHHHRDENAPRTMLRYAFDGAWWTGNGAGTAPIALA